jgi:hypothetical protein
MTAPRPSSARWRQHHLAIAATAIVVAIALALNYYLW